MGIRSFFGLDCEAAANACDRAAYNEAGLADKLRLKFHLFLCPPCKDYTRKSEKLNYLLKKADLKSCTEEEKVAFRQRMEEKNSESLN